MVEALRGLTSPARLTPAALVTGLVLLLTTGITLGVLVGPWLVWLDTAPSLKHFAQQPTLRPLALSLWTAGASTALAAWATNLILARTMHTPRHHGWLASALGWALATPHLAFALALGWLIAPTGWLWRVISQSTDWPQQPLDWTITHDPFGFTLIAVLFFKELPFLLWVGLAEWQRPDQQLSWHRQWSAAQTWGYSPWRAWKLAVAPDLWTRLRWPTVAVWAYGMGVVDVAMAIGPTTRPTAAVQAWRWINDANPDIQHSGFVLSLWLSGLVAGGAFVMARAPWRALSLVPLAQAPQRHKPVSWWWMKAIAKAPASVAALYVVLLALSAILSLSLWWPFPQVWPSSWSTRAWATVAQSADVVVTTLSLAVLSTAASMLMMVAWFEAAPKRWFSLTHAWALAWLICPPLMWLWGVYQLALMVNLQGTWSAVFIGHVLAVLPYVVLTLGPTYASFDDRYTQAAATLGHGYWSQRWQVKWPLMAGPLWRAAAIGFAVSVAQYLPTQWLGGGRIATLTTEALSQSSGGQRNISAAWALAQWVLPMLVFVWSTRRAKRHNPKPTLSKQTGLNSSV